MARSHRLGLVTAVATVVAACGSSSGTGGTASSSSSSGTGGTGGMASSSSSSTSSSSNSTSSSSPPSAAPTTRHASSIARGPASSASPPASTPTTARASSRCPLSPARSRSWCSRERSRGCCRRRCGGGAHEIRNAVGVLMCTGQSAAPQIQARRAHPHARPIGSRRADTPLPAGPAKAPHAPTHPVSRVPAGTPGGSLSPSSSRDKPYLPRGRAFAAARGRILSL